jgi:mannose-6-phosphate isomerase-like protein (cupin superfamily)
VLDIVEDDGPRSYTIDAGMLVIVPPGLWHRFHSADVATTMSVVVPGENIDHDVDDPRQVERAPA